MLIVIKYVFASKAKTFIFELMINKRNQNIFKVAIDCQCHQIMTLIEFHNHNFSIDDVFDKGWYLRTNTYKSTIFGIYIIY